MAGQPRPKGQVPAGVVAWEVAANEPSALRVEARPDPAAHEVHHACGHRWCMTVEHFEALPKGEHARREAQRRREDKQKAAEASETGADEALPTEPAAADTFAIALFAGVDQPAVQPRMVSLD